MRSLWSLRRYAYGLLPYILIALPLMSGAAWLNVRALSATKPVLDDIFPSLAAVEQGGGPAAAPVSVPVTLPWEKKAVPAQTPAAAPAAASGRMLTPAEREQRRNEAMARIVHHAMIFLILTLIAATANAFSLYLGDFIGQRVLVRLRNSVFAHLQTLSMSFFDRRRSGELISRVNNDTLVLQKALGTDMFKIIVSPLVIIFMVLRMISLSPTLTAVLGLAIPVTALMTVYTARYARRYSRRTQVKMADLTAVTQESFVAMRVIKTFGLEPQSQKRFDREATAVLKAEMKTALVKAIGMPPVYTMVGAVTAAALIFGGHQIISGNVAPPTLVMFMLYLQLAAVELVATTRLYVQLQNAEAAAERTLSVLGEAQEVQDDPEARDLESVEGRITFEHVSFSYDEEHTVLNDFCLEVAPGEVVALAGPSGAGKSTVASLVPRLYDPRQGRLLIDGVDVTTVTQRSLKRFMGMVPQETILFSTSVRDNIAFGREGATEEEIVAAARAAHAHDFILSLPDGYDTQVGERGTRLSGGQRQRIAIARAFLRDPRILILDEATSALDTESEAAVHAALETLLQGRTAIIIAHRLSTIRNADRIVVMAAGEIVEQGTHDELLEQDGLYRRLYESKELMGHDGGSDQPPTPSVTVMPLDLEDVPLPEDYE